MRIAGIRFTFSKSGLSTSVGAKGLRITSGPRGVYVTTGFGGFYYRQRLGDGARPRYRAPPRPTPEAPAQQFYATETIQSASVEHLTDVSQDEFVSSLNEWTKHGMRQIMTAVVVVVAVVVGVALQAAQRTLTEIATYGVIAFLLARFIEHRRRRFLLIYDLGNAEAKRYQRLGDALADLAASGRFRAVKMIGHHFDWKRNAGATRSLSFESASLRTGVPPYIVTNLVPWALSLQAMQLYFFPDRVLIRSRGRFAALSYQALELSTHTSNFVWDEPVPVDAEIVGQTWLYVRRDGGPDRRFNGNRPIPLVRTAYVAFKSETGLEAVVQTTRTAAAGQFQREAHIYGHTTHATPAIREEIDPKLRDALATFGMTAVPSFVELKKTYHELAQRNHPDRFTRAPRDIRLFADQRMKEIHDAYELLRDSVKHTPSTEAISAGNPVAPAANVARVQAWRSVETLASCAAVIVAGLVFAGFRSTPMETRRIVPAQEVVASNQILAAQPAVESLLPRKHILIACPLRTEPSPKARQLALVPKSTELELLENRDGWWRVRDGQGSEGWTGPKCWQPVVTRTAAPARVAAPPRPHEPARESKNTESSAGVPVDPYAESSGQPSSTPGPPVPIAAPDVAGSLPAGNNGRLVPERQ